MEPLPWYRVLAPVGLAVFLTLLAYFRDDVRIRSMVSGLWLMVGYAILQDQVSARLCPEYFTIFHQPIPGLTDPTLLGIAWGFLGSWWGGALMGYSAGLTATVGEKPPLPFRTIFRGMLLIMGAVAIMAILVGVSTARHVQLLGVTIDEQAMLGVPIDNQRNAFIVANYHMVAYATAIVGSVILCLGLARQRNASQ
jgi:hypothetical protein